MHLQTKQHGLLHFLLHPTQCPLTKKHSKGEAQLDTIRSDPDVYSRNSSNLVH